MDWTRQGPQHVISTLGFEVYIKDRYHVVYADAVVTATVEVELCPGLSELLADTLKIERHPGADGKVLPLADIRDRITGGLLMLDVPAGWVK